MTNVLLSGSSGFLGLHIFKSLKKESINIVTLGRAKNCDIRHDLAHEIPELLAVDRVIHLAGKAHSIPSNLKEEEEFFETNFTGTKNLCVAFDRLGEYPKQFVFISSVSVYGLVQGNNIDESSPLIGNSSYALSKIFAENFLMDWGKINGVQILIFRLPLIVGHNPPGNLGKMINSIKRGKYFRIGSGNAKKSMVLVDDIAEIILATSEREGIYNLTDDSHPSFFQLENYICNKLKKSKLISIPYYMAMILGKVGDIFPFFIFNSNTFQKITSDLTFSNNKAKIELGWNPRNILDSDWI